MGCLSRIEEAEEQTRKVVRESVAGDKKRKRNFPNLCSLATTPSEAGYKCC